MCVEALSAHRHLRAEAQGLGGASPPGRVDQHRADAYKSAQPLKGNIGGGYPPMFHDFLDF